MCKEVNRVFYISPEYPEKLKMRDLDTGDERVLFQNGSNISIYQFINLAPTWDGSKVYFYVEFSEK
jgi:hypothetical protein